MVCCQKNECQPFVLGLIGMELIFLVAAHIRCCVLDWWPKQHWWYINILAIAEQHRHRVKAFSVSGVGRRLGGDTAGTADPNWPKRYSIPYSIMFSNKLCVLGGSSCYLETGWMQVCWWGGSKWLPSHCYFLLFFLSLHLLNCLYLDPWGFLLVLFDSLP